MNPLIEKKIAAFNDCFREWFLAESGSPAEKELYTFLTTALQEALLAGIEMAEGAVPEYIAGSLATERHAGYEYCRTETLSRLAALKKEVVDGNPNT